MNYSFTRISANVKTGQIPVTMSHKETCPNACELKGNGCYAQSGHVNIHWSNISNGKRGISWGQLIDNIKALPKGQLWRHNVAGDLPHNDGLINWVMVYDLVQANKGKQGFTYTHHMVEGRGIIASENRDSIRRMNDHGFTVNLSANSPSHADRLSELSIGPIVTVTPIEWGESSRKVYSTPKGRSIVICPAVTTDGMTCEKCRLCANPNRKSIIGFPAHGVQKRKVIQILNNGA